MKSKCPLIMKKSFAFWISHCPFVFMFAFMINFLCALCASVVNFLVNL